MNYGGCFDTDTKNKRISELENLMQASDFWDNRDKSESVITELNSLKKTINEVSYLKNR